METIYTEQEILTMLEYQTTQEFIQMIKADMSDDLYNKHQYDYLCNLHINILSNLKNTNKTKLWNIYVEKAELIINSEII